MENVVLNTMVTAQMNVAALVTPGGRRAAIHTNNGHSETAASSRDQGSLGDSNRNEHSAQSTTIATTPSATSLLDGALRSTDTSPIRSGATVTVPRESEATQ